MILILCSRHHNRYVMSVFTCNSTTVTFPSKSLMSKVDSDLLQSSVGVPFFSHLVSVAYKGLSYFAWCPSASCTAMLG